MASVTLASLQNMRKELVNSKYYLNIRSGYMAPVTLHCSYGDSGETITFYIFDGGDELDLTGSVVSIHGTRRDGANFGPFSCTVSGNAVSFQLQDSMTAVEGGGIAEFTITKNGATVGTCNFGIMVEDAVFPNGVAYSSDPSVYQDILAYVQSIPSKLTIDYINRITAVESSLSNSISNEASARVSADTTNANAIAVERSRIDNYLTSGTAATNSELVDIRVDKNGKTHTTAGKSVRHQAKENSASAQNGMSMVKSITYHDAEKIQLTQELTTSGLAYVDSSTGNIAFQASGSHKYMKLVNPNILEITIPQSSTSSSVAAVIICDNSSVGRAIRWYDVSTTADVVIDVTALNVTTQQTFYINWFNANVDGHEADYYDHVYIKYRHPNYLTKTTLLTNEYGKSVYYRYADMDLMDGYGATSNTINNPISSTAHSHFIIESDNIKTISVTQSATPYVASVIYYENESSLPGQALINGNVTSYTFSTPTKGLLCVNYFGGGDHAKGITITYFSLEELVANSAKTYKHQIRKPFVFSGKSIEFTGDSITAGFTSGSTTTQNGYPKLFSEAVGATFTNRGVGGSTLSVVSGYQSIQTQIQNANKNCNFLFVAGGINDWQLGVELATFTSAVETICDYINSNFSQSTKVVWITPINHAGWDKTHEFSTVAGVDAYRQIITEVVIQKDTYSRFSIIQGKEFNFPVYGDREDYIASTFGDRLHPTELGYKNVYVPGLLNVLC